jgi:hypothetical protein
MGWPIGWSSLIPLPKENYDDWKRKTLGRTETSAKEIRGYKMSNVWWDDDPSGTPYRPQSTEQFAGEHQDTLPELPQGRAHAKRRLGKGGGSEEKMSNLWKGISTKKATPGDTLRRPRMLEEKGQIIGRTAVGIKYRVDRLTALGNGQVPGVVREAWERLSK